MCGSRLDLIATSLTEAGGGMTARRTYASASPFSLPRKPLKLHQKQAYLRSFVRSFIAKHGVLLVFFRTARPRKSPLLPFSEIRLGKGIPRKWDHAAPDEACSYRPRTPQMAGI